MDPSLLHQKLKEQTLSVSRSGPSLEVRGLKTYDYILKWIRNQNILSCMNWQGYRLHSSRREYWNWAILLREYGLPNG